MSSPPQEETPESPSPSEEAISSSPFNHPLDDDPFPSQQPSISQLLSQLRRSTLTPHNRLTSIHADASFVSRVASAFPRRPLVANERCGSWYVRPREKWGSAYFKSTDGHERAWKFSTRRLNLHLVDMIEGNDGIIIVDSTRRGKRMPDALSTTIPIWCTVLNLALLPDHPLSSRLFLPPYLPPTTHAQITLLIPQFLSSLRALNLTLPTSLTKPLRPFWVTQDSSLPDPEEEDGEKDGEKEGEEGKEGEDPNSSGVIYTDYRPIICCTASRRITSSEVDAGGYIQGAGDDTENWAMGLTPDLFWSHSCSLLSASEAELPTLIAHLVAQQQAEKQAGSGEPTPRTRLTLCLSVCPLPVSPSPQANECFIVLTQNTTPKESWIKSPTHIEVGLGKNKNASRNLRLALPDICDFASKYLQSRPYSKDDSGESGQLVVACDSGKDISVGAALALSCYLFDDNGQFRVPAADASFTKTLVKVRLGTIMTVYPEANPSRATLQSVNSFLMDWRK
ncbi:hypothetical protein PT974_07070 [Cladobotryum mycophilum]|uniref:Initiator tRNA phosphoribosyl transferase n=1 Tax=Cladobotryum mycophilum TaxID=491253 RepID=A0ABR0SPG1_9HYPO